jgi:hypothetical protein
LDVLGFGALTVGIVIAIQVFEKLLGKPFSVPAGPFEAAGFADIEVWFEFEQSF